MNDKTIYAQVAQLVCKTPQDQRGISLGKVRNELNGSDSSQLRESNAKERPPEKREVVGSSPPLRAISKIRPFQFRWKEALGKPECPYAYRWTLNLCLFSIRVHQWIRSDDKRFFHDHPWHFITLVLRGSYTDVSESGRDVLKVGSVRFRKATHRHYVEVPQSGCVTILVTSAKVREWGFWVKEKFKRPLRYFGKFGHPPCSEL